MTVSVELLLEVAVWIASAFLVVTWIWRIKSKNSFDSRVAALLTTTALTALEVGNLTVNCLTGKSYVANICLVLMWWINVVISAFDMRD